MPTLMELSKGRFIDLDKIILIEEVKADERPKLINAYGSTSYLDRVFIQFQGDTTSHGMSTYKEFMGDDANILSAWLDDFRSK